MSWIESKRFWRIKDVSDLSNFNFRLRKDLMPSEVCNVRKEDYSICGEVADIKCCICSQWTCFMHVELVKDLREDSKLRNRIWYNSDTDYVCVTCRAAMQDELTPIRVDDMITEVILMPVNSLRIFPVVGRFSPKVEAAITDILKSGNEGTLEYKGASRIYVVTT